MNIGELLNETTWTSLIKRFRNDPTITHSNFREKLEELFEPFGWKLIGEGCFAGVFANSKFPNWVYKVIHKDMAYKEWYNFCQRNLHNPYLPKFSKKEDTIMLRDGYYAVRMEKLKPMSQHLYENFLPYVAFLGLNNPASDSLKSEAYYLLPDPKPSSTNDLIATLEEKFYGELSHNDQTDLYEIKIFFEETGYSMDIHDENLMIRPKNNQIVFSDPLVDFDNMDHYDY